jgi:hypothetical protein
MHPEHDFLVRADSRPRRCSFVEGDFYNIPAALIGEHMCGRLAAYTLTISRVAEPLTPDVNEADLCVEHTAHVRACRWCIDPAAIRTHRAAA